MDRIHENIKSVSRSTSGFMQLNKMNFEGGSIVRNTVTWV